MFNIFFLLIKNTINYLGICQPKYGKDKNPKTQIYYTSDVLVNEFVP
jgi:hypothetical protein